MKSSGSLHTENGINNVVGLLHGRFEVFREWYIEVFELLRKTLDSISLTCCSNDVLSYLIELILALLGIVDCWAIPIMPDMPSRYKAISAFGQDQLMRTSYLSRTMMIPLLPGPHAKRMRFPLLNGCSLNTARFETHLMNYPDNQGIPACETERPASSMS